MSAPSLRIPFILIMSFTLLSCNKQNNAQNNLVSTTDLGKHLTNAVDYFDVKSLVPASSKIFNLADSSLALNDYLYRVWVLDPYGAKIDFNLYTLRIFQFGSVNGRDTATMFILRFYYTEKPSYSFECSSLNYRPIKGWSDFSERRKSKQLIFTEPEEFSISESDGVRTVLYFQQIFRSQIVSYDFSRGYQFYEPNTALEEKFKRLLFFIESEFGIQLYKFEYGGGFFDKEYLEVTEAD
jgi:hypothetical protein